MAKDISEGNQGDELKGYRLPINKPKRNFPPVQAQQLPEPKAK